MGNKRDGLAVVFLLALCLLFFGLSPLLSGRAVIGSNGFDLPSMFLPWRSFGFASLKAGNLPLWNPYIFSGMPFIAGLQSAVFYPLNLIFCVLPTPLAVNYSIILNVFLSGIFMLLFVRSLGVSRAGSVIASSAFMFGSLQAPHIFSGHLPQLCSIIWIPVVLLLYGRSAREKSAFLSLVGGLALCMQVLAGYPQYFFYTVLAAAVYSLVLFFEKKDGRCFSYFVLMLFSCLLIASLQLFPALEIVKNSIRNDTLTYEFCTQCSFPPENFLTLLVPSFFGDVARTLYWGRWYFWEVCIYVGILPLALAVLSLLSVKKDRNTLFLSILAVAGIFLALGRYNPLNRLIYTAVPGFNMFRAPGKWLCLAVFSFSALAGQGFDTVLDRSSRAKLLEKILLLSVTVFGIATAVLVLQGGSSGWKSLMEKSIRMGERYTAIQEPVEEGLVRGAFSGAAEGMVKSCLLLSASFIFLALFNREKIRKNLAAMLILCLVALDLFSFGSGYVRTSDMEKALSRVPESVTGFLKKDRSRYRIMTPLKLVNQGMKEGIENISGYEANVLRTYNSVINISQNKPLSYPQLPMKIDNFSPILDFLNVRYVIMPPDEKASGPPQSPLFSDGEYEVYENPSFMPRAFVAEKVLALKADEIAGRMRRGDFDPERETLVPLEETGVRKFLDAGRDTESAVITSYGAGSVQVRARLSRPGLLVLSDAYYPGWQVYTDGKRGVMYHANLAFRAVPLGEGEHNVKFIYNPSSFGNGLIISLLAMFVLPLTLKWGRRDRRGEENAALWAGIAVFVLSFFVYMRTCCPAVYTGDSGEFSACSGIMGIAHPPGYPLYCILGKFFSFLPLGAIAFRVNLMSAFFSALAAMLVYFIIIKLLGRDKSLIAVCGALMLAFSSTMWSESLIAEVYTLNAFFVAACVYVLMLWRQGRENRLLCLFGFVYGLSLANHYMMFLFAPAFACFVLIETRGKIEGRTLIVPLLLFLMGLLIYLYLPARSVKNPALDWGETGTLRGFFDHIKRVEYEQLEFGSALDAKTKLLFAVHFVKELCGQFGVFLALIGILGAWTLCVKEKGFFAGSFLIFLANSMGLILLLQFPYDREKMYVVQVYYIPAYMIMSVWIAAGLERILHYLSGSIKGLYRPSSFALLAIPAVLLIVNYAPNDLSGYFLAYDHNMNILSTVKENGIIFTRSDRITFPLWYLKYAEKQRRDVIEICQPALAQEYYVRQLKQRNPDVFASLDEGSASVNERINAIVEHNMPARTVYFTFNTGLDLPAKYRLEQQGLVFRVFEMKDFDINRYKEENERILADYEFRTGWGTYGKDNRMETEMTVRDIAGSFLNMGALFSSYGLNGEAIDMYERGLMVDAENQDLKANMVSILPAVVPSAQKAGSLDVALNYFNNKEYRAAILEFERLIEAGSGEKYRLLNNIGLCYYRLGEWDKALEQYRESLRINPGYAAAHYNAGLVYSSRDESRKAIREYRAALKIDPGYSKAREKLKSYGVTE